MSVSRRASFAAGIAAVRRERRERSRAEKGMSKMDPVNEVEDANKITVVAGFRPNNPVNTANTTNVTKTKPRIEYEVKQFTKESLEKINLRTANLIRDYGFLPKRTPHLEDGAQLPGKFEPFPNELLGKPVEELDQFVYEKVKLSSVTIHITIYINI